MNKRNKIITALLAGSLMSAAWLGTTYAGGHGHQMAPGFERASCKHGHGKHGHGKRGEWGFRGLDLTDAQREQVSQIMGEQRPKMRELRTAMQANRKALREAATTDELDRAKVQDLADQQAKLKAEMIVLRTEIRHRIYGLLTEQQRAQLKERQERREQRQRDF